MDDRSLTVLSALDHGKEAPRGFRRKGAERDPMDFNVLLLMGRAFRPRTQRSRREGY